MGFYTLNSNLSYIIKYLPKQNIFIYIIKVDIKVKRICDLQILIKLTH